MLLMWDSEPDTSFNTIKDNLMGTQRKMWNAAKDEGSNASLWLFQGDGFHGEPGLCVAYAMGHVKSVAEYGPKEYDPEGEDPRFTGFVRVYKS